MERLTSGCEIVCRLVNLGDAANVGVRELLLRQHTGETAASGGDDGFNHAVGLGEDLDFVLMHKVLLLFAMSCCKRSVG